MKGKKTGGRAKGTPNKLTTDFKGWLKELLADNAEQIEEDFKRLDSRERLNIVTKILPYLVPREVERMEVTTHEEQPLFCDYEPGSEHCKTCSHCNPQSKELTPLFGDIEE